MEGYYGQTKKASAGNTGSMNTKNEIIISDEPDTSIYHFPNVSDCITQHEVNARYAAMGFKCIPEINKKPLLNDWLNKATDDIKMLEGWFDFYKEATTTITTGKRSGLIILDVDEKDGKRGIEVLTQTKRIGVGKGLDDVTIIKTPSGGIHIPFLYPTNRKIKTYRHEFFHLSGLEILSDGAKFSAPSIGNDYKIIQSLPLTEPPEWFWNLVDMFDEAIEEENKEVEELKKDREANREPGVSVIYDDAATWDWLISQSFAYDRGSYATLYHSNERTKGGWYVYRDKPAFCRHPSHGYMHLKEWCKKYHGIDMPFFGTVYKDETVLPKKELKTPPKPEPEPKYHAHSNGDIEVLRGKILGAYTGFKEDDNQAHIIITNPGAGKSISIPKAFMKCCYARAAYSD